MAQLEVAEQLRAKGKKSKAKGRSKKSRKPVAIEAPAVSSTTVGDNDFDNVFGDDDANEVATAAAPQNAANDPFSVLDAPSFDGQNGTPANPATANTTTTSSSNAFDLDELFAPTLEASSRTWDLFLL